MTPPSAIRCLALVALAAASLGLLIATPAAAWPPTDPQAVVPWWEAVGTAGAASSIVRVVGVGLAAWTTLLGVVGFAAASSPRRGILTCWSHLGPGPIRRLLTVGLIAAVAVGATPAAADDTESAPPTMLVDLGPVADDAASASLLVDVGPPSRGEPGPLARPTDSAAGATSPEARRAPTGPPTVAGTEADRWVVARGDHLWAVASATLAARGLPADDAATARYWVTLIEANRAVVGDDPDLVHPGEVLVLPPTDAVRAGS